MAQRKWTDEQLAAIETRDKTLLVSAAAGSGKTATLTERIIRSLTDEEKPVDITSLLVVTFTNAAAAELRVKISAALESAVKANPDNERLSRQLYLLPSAKIRTIDGFCNDILRANSDRVGLMPNYRIADEAECELLAGSILEGLIESIYSAEVPEVASAEEFEELCDCLSDSKRSEEVSEVFRYIHAKCESNESGARALEPLIEKYNPETFTTVEDSSHGAYLMKISKELFLHYKGIFEKYEKLFALGTSSEQKYLVMLQSDLDLLTKLVNSATYSELREEILSYTLLKKPGVKKDRTDRMESLSAIRDMFREELTELRSYFLYTEGEWKSLFASLYRLLSVLYRFVLRFDEIFSEEKRRRSALSYADIERYAYMCLVKDGKPTDIAENLKNRFEAVYIDEYQDVNSLQNSIFAAISRENNRFMVGDIKQSIYGFRSARPEIFASMKSSFPPLDAAEGDCASIFMSKNFRCDKGIVDFVNGIFDKAFSLIGESIGYRDGDRLGYAKLHEGEVRYRAPKICMLDKKPNANNKSYTPDDEEDYDAPLVVARKIKELLADEKLNSGEKIKPSDVAIIMRNARGKDRLYAEALESLGIPSEISGGESFFLSAEVLLAMCLLNSIDNPRRDVYLAGLMCSPLFGFTADDLYNIRREKSESSLYVSVKRYTEEHPEFEKGERFLSTLAHYRAISEGVGVDTLLFKLYHETGLLALASRSGGEENLNLLYDYARSYEAGAFKGLYNFINFINNIINKKTTFDDNRELGESDAVKIITCHASKGLEYPVVFLVDAGARLENRDKKNRLVFSEDFGISLRLRTEEGYAVVNNPVQDLTNHYIYSKLYEEELRVLYVALTRAREELFVVGTAPTVNRDEYEALLDVKREWLNPYLFKNLSSTLEVMLVAGEVSRPLTKDEFLNMEMWAGISPAEANAEMSAEANAETSAEANAEMPAEANNEMPAEANNEMSAKANAEMSAKANNEMPAEDTDKETSDLAGFTDELIRRFTYEYPRLHLSTLPEKMSVSRTSPHVLDEDVGVTLFEEDGKAGEDEEKKRTLPRFVEGNKAEESAKRGIATHYLLQFCDLECLEKNGAEAELHRLIDAGFISPEDGERVRIREIELFRRSDLFRQMKSAKNLYREFRFNTALPAQIFTENEEKRASYKNKTVLVQGVIDCLIEYEDGSFGLFDYKTDRLTREELADRSLAEKTLRDKHSLQLSYYALAVEKIFGSLPKRVEVYSLPLGETVNVKI